MNKLRNWYAGLQAREQRMVLFGSIALALLLLIGGVVLPLQSAVSNARERAQSRRDDLEWMRANAPEIREGTMSLRHDTGEAPVVLVDRTGHEAGLGSALRGTQPSGATGVRVQLEGAPFDSLVQWLDTLEQRNGLSIESITIDRAAQAGAVNASVTLNQTKH